MKRGKGFAMMLVGVVMGVCLTPVAARAAESFLQAFPSTQTFFVDGRQVQLEAYGINGYNYVKLRDIGEAVGFNVYYDAKNNAAMLESSKPYTGKPPVETTSKNATATLNIQAEKANPAAFNGELTQEVFNGIRDGIVNRDAIESGKRTPLVFKGTEKANQVATTISLFPKYSLTAEGDGLYSVSVKRLPVYDTAVKHTQSFIDALSGRSQKEQVEQIAWYVCDRMTYAHEYPFVDKVLSQDDQVRGCCMAYAYSVQFLCNRADIPCILVQSTSHQWNEVYVDGQWWAVDVTDLDAGDDVQIRPYLSVLAPLSEMQGQIYTDTSPDITRFAKEVLVPGSTK